MSASVNTSLSTVPRPKSSYLKMIAIGSILLFLASLWLPFLLNGSKLSPDSTSYLNVARQLEALDFNVFALLHERDASDQMYFRLLFVSLVAVMDKLLGTRWGDGIVFLNLAATTATFIYLWRTLREYRLGSITIMFGAVLAWLCIDIRLWQTFALADVLFACGIAVLSVKIPRLIIERHGDLSSLLFSMLLLTAVSLIRPNGIPFAAAIACVWLQERFTSRRLPIRTDLRIWFASSACVFVAILGYGFFLFKEAPNAAYFESYGPRSLLGFFKTGIIIHDRPSTNVMPPTTYFDYIHLLLTRLAYFFAPTVSGFSATHKLLNLAFFIPAGIGVLYGAHIAIFSIGLPTQIKTTLNLSLFYIIFTAIFHACTLIDYDWRYRFPVLAPMIIVSMFALQAALARHGGRISRINNPFSENDPIAPAAKDAGAWLGAAAPPYQN